MAVLTLEQKKRKNETTRVWRENNPEKVKAYQSEYYQKNKEARKKGSKKWKKENPEAVKSHSLKHLYGITLSDKVRMYENQNGLCLLCEKNFNCSDLVVDHCHTSGEVRALLCKTCNTGFGMFYENPAALRRAASFAEGRITVPR